MNIDKINVGDKFSTENKLLEKLGCPKTSGNSRLSLLKDVQCYFDYTKTGKISRGKETNEIVITNKYVEPKSKQDGRVSEVVEYIKPLILSMENKSIGNKGLFMDEFKIVDKDVWNKIRGNNNVEFYKYYLLNDFKDKVKTSLKRLYKEHDWFYYSYEYLLIKLEEDKYIYQVATQSQTEYIDSIKENIKDKIVARYKLEHPNDKSKSWNKLSYRYTSTLYKLVNDECRDAFEMDKCVEVIIIDKSETINCETAQMVNQVKKYYKSKMDEWIKKKEYREDFEILSFHNEIFKDVN